MRIVYLLPRLCSIFLIVGLKWDKGLAQNKYLSDEDYIPEEEELENTTSSLDIDFNLENDVYGEYSSVYKTSTIVYREKLDLRKYRKLAINDMRIDLHADDLSDDSENEENIIKVYFQFDILFECDLPSEMFKGSFDWSVNGYLIGHNESSHTIIINEIETNPKFLNVSCYFELNEDTNEASSLQFPSIQIGTYLI